MELPVLMWWAGWDAQTAHFFKPESHSVYSFPWTNKWLIAVSAYYAKTILISYDVTKNNIILCVTLFLTLGVNLIIYRT